MIAKFRSEKALDECVKYAKPQALGALMIGLVIGIGAVAGGVAVMTVKSIAGGILLMASLLIMSFMLCYYGLVGAGKMIKANTILMKTESKDIEIGQDEVTEETTAIGATEKRVIGFEHVSGVVLRGGMFVFYIADGTSILCDVLNVTEGDIDELREFLYNKFGKLYHEKKGWDKGLVSSGTDKNTVESTTDIADTNAEDSNSAE